MTHIMLDLETFGTRPGSVIRSIGAVPFVPHSTTIGEGFYRNIEDQSCLDIGMTKDADTVKWWETQSRQAQDSLLVDQRPFLSVAEEFVDWMRGHGSPIVVWSQGSNFDTVLWEAACLLARRSVPWKFYNTRDTRTAYDMGGVERSLPAREGTYHNALDDARHQARCVQLAYRSVKR